MPTIGPPSKLVVPLASQPPSVRREETMMPKRILTIVAALAVTFVGGVAEGGSDRMSEISRYFTNLEQIALGEGEIPLQEYGRDKFPQEVSRSQNLAEKGMYREAAVVLSTLLEGEMAADWRAMLTTRVQILQKWAGSKNIELFDYRQFYLNTGPEWFRNRAKPIVTLWKMNGVDEAQKYALLRELLAKRSDKEGERLILEAIASSKGATKDEAANALLEIGNQHYQSGNYDQAEAMWFKVKKRFPDSEAWGKAVFNLGLLHKEKNDFSRAIDYFSSLLGASVNDLEPGGHIMKAYRNYRSSAQWEIGNCLFAQGKYHEALDAYRHTEEKYPFQSWCGNAHAEYQYRYAFYNGLCYDWLGDPRTAVGLYYKAISNSVGLYSNPLAHLRIVDLYEAAAQIQDLQQLLDFIDEQHLSEVRRHLQGRDQMADEEVLKWSPSQTMRRILTIRRMEENGDWEALISLLKIKGTVAGPNEAYARRENWEATEGARLLAKHSKETVPLLIAWVDEADSQDVKWLYYALGRCGTEEAVQALKAYALKETNCWWTDAVVYALSLADKKGDVALRELAELSKGNLKGSILRYRQGKIGDRNDDVDFPEVRHIPNLPKTLEEMRIAQPSTPADG